ncbi:MAG TPA: SAM-dependent methyltransferase [Trebonia sp.]|nr:SAM-dependent methyltransferase [Trebonia sp.]
MEYERVQAPYGDPDADGKLARDVADGVTPDHDRMHEYLRARTAFFDRVVVSAIDRGVRQVVVGAAGYDGRALRYAKDGVRWFEVDHPATQTDKLERLRRLGIGTGHLRFVPADFTTDPVAHLLTDAGLDAREASLFLLEGVAVYLDLDVLERVLEQFRLVTTKTGVLAISVSTSADGAGRQRFRERVAELGEPARSFLSADDAGGLLARAGWRVTDPEPRTARRRAAGLLVAQAERPQIRPREDRPAPSSGTTGIDRSDLPLSALAAHALIACTIEFDNEFEHRMPHLSTDHGRAPGAPRDAPWLTSLVMWESGVRHVPDEGITVAELKRKARCGTNVDGLRRWGYVTLTSPAGEVAGRAGWASTLPKIKPDTVVRRTDWGRVADRTWRDLDDVVEARWRDRLSAERVRELRDALAAVVTSLDQGLPDCMRILGYGLLAGVTSPPPDSPGAPLRDLPLRALLSRLLTAFAAEFEDESGLSLPMSATVLRVLSADLVRRRDIPALSGVSKEAVAMALGLLRSSGLAAEEPAPDGARGKIVRLTPAGTAAQARYASVTAAIEERWRARCGGDAVAALRRSLEGIGGNLGEGLAPYPEGWRARESPRILPDYPMVLHRGGYPDGA